MFSIFFKAIERPENTKNQDIRCDVAGVQHIVQNLNVTGNKENITQNNHNYVCNGRSQTNTLK